jgi:hypothetical protein
MSGVLFTVCLTACDSAGLPIALLPSATEGPRSSQFAPPVEESAGPTPSSAAVVACPISNDQLELWLGGPFMSPTPVTSSLPQEIGLEGLPADYAVYATPFEFPRITYTIGPAGFTCEPSIMGDGAFSVDLNGGILSFLYQRCCGYDSTCPYVEAARRAATDRGQDPKLCERHSSEFVTDIYTGSPLAHASIVVDVGARSDPTVDQSAIWVQIWVGDPADLLDGDILTKGLSQSAVCDLHKNLRKVCSRSLAYFLRQSEAAPQMTPRLLDLAEATIDGIVAETK